jgi:hypothetical protein
MLCAPQLEGLCSQDAVSVVYCHAFFLQERYAARAEWMPLFTLPTWSGSEGAWTSTGCVLATTRRVALYFSSFSTCPPFLSLIQVVRLRLLAPNSLQNFVASLTMHQVSMLLISKRYHKPKPSFIACSLKPLESSGAAMQCQEG